MLPAVILVIYALIMLLVFLVLIPILGMIFRDKLQEYLDQIAQQKHQESVDVTVVLSVIWIVFAVVTGLCWPFYTVPRSSTIYRIISRL